MIEVSQETEDVISSYLSDFFYGMENDGIIVFDTETNGDNPKDSVLSVSALLLKLDYDKKTVFPVSSFQRFYHCVEPESPKAIIVNGLTKDKVEKLREETFKTQGAYPKYFKDDNSFNDFCSGVTSYIGHNLSFDLQFTPYVNSKNVFDTMLTNINVVKSSWNEYRKQWKWPKLLETANYYKIKVDESKLHDSFYDVEITAEVFKEMMQLGAFRLKADLPSIYPF